MWNLAPPPGFRGFDPRRNVRVYFYHLPHWRQQGATYFVTYRLGDSLPQNKLQELAALRAEWERRYPPPRSDAVLNELAHSTMQRMETWLDQGMGSCVLQDKTLADIVARAMHYFDGQRYELDAYAVMPNHVHLLVCPFGKGDWNSPSRDKEGDRQPECRGDFQSLPNSNEPPPDDALERILQSWKHFTSAQINRKLGRCGQLWQKGSFDRIVRDEEHLYRCLRYIGSNPSRGALPRERWIRWVRPEWEELGWGFEDLLEKRGPIQDGG